MAPTLIDTGPLVALLSQSQQHHVGCKKALSTLSLPLVTCWPVLVEAAYLLRHRHGLVNTLLQSSQQGFLQILPLEDVDTPRIVEIRDKYQDQNFDLTDVCLMYLSEREGIEDIFTLDSDFRIFRPSHVNALRVIEIDGVA